MQLQSDYAQTQVVRPENIESTAFGAAYLAGLGSGFWSSMAEIKKLATVDRTFKPEITTKKLNVRLLSWRKAIRQTIIESAGSRKKVT